MNPQVPTPEQLQQVLLKAFTDKADAEAKVKEASDTITAVRNLLTGYAAAAQLAAAATPASPPST